MADSTTNLGEALAAELAKLDPEERMLLEEIHQSRNALYLAELNLRLFRARKAAPAPPTSGGHGG
jgi:hypothetical protein